MAAEVDFAGVLCTAVSDCRVATPARAFSALEGFLQWFATLAVIDKEDSLVMLRGDVDRIWHAALIHTAMLNGAATEPTPQGALSHTGNDYSRIYAD